MATTIALVLAMAGTALASGHLFKGDPCEADMPGNSEYAQNHIVFAAHNGALGQDHKPGVHAGFAGLCAPGNSNPLG